jgi:hypothetical protein
VASAGSAEIRTDVAPCFADVFARFTSKGAFPPIPNVIQLPGGPYRLLVNGSNAGLRLTPAVTAPNPRPELALSAPGANRIRLLYDAATLHLDIQDATWSLDLPGLRIWADLMGIDKFSGTEYHLVGSTTQRPQLRDILTFLDSGFEDALRFIPGFLNRGTFGPIDLKATNVKHELKIATGFEKKIDLGPAELSFSGYTDVGFTEDSATGLTTGFTGVKVGAGLQAKIYVYPPVFVIFGLEFEAGVKSLFTGATQTEIQVAAFVGVGAGFHVGPFAAEAWLAVGVVVVYEDPTFKVGGLVRVEAEVDLEVVTVTIEGEFKGVFYKDMTGATLCDYGGEMSVNVEIFWFFQIKATYEVSDTAKV